MVGLISVNALVYPATAAALVLCSALLKPGNDAQVTRMSLPSLVMAVILKTSGVATVHCCVTEQPFESFTRSVNVESPATVGMPETTPVTERLKPAGSAPLRTLNPYGPVPPLAVIVWL